MNTKIKGVRDCVFVAQKVYNVLFHWQTLTWSSTEPVCFQVRKTTKF